MNTLVTMAISKAISGNSKTAKDARAAMTVGEHNVKATVVLDGKLIVEEDQEIKATASILNEDFLALVLHHAGITREAAVKAITEVAGEYLVDWTGSKEDKANAKAARKAKLASIDPDGKISNIFATFADTLPKVPRAGKVTFKGKVEEVSQPVLTIVENEEGVA